MLGGLTARLDQDQARGHLAMLAFSALVAGSFSLGSRAAIFLDPAALNAVRFAVAGLVIGVAAIATVGIPRTAFVAPWRYLILGGVFGSYFVLMFEGLKTAAPVSTAAVFTLTPVLTAAFSYLLLRQVLTRRMAVALAVGAFGALWVIFRGDLALALRFEVGRGEVIYFIGCIAHALFIPLSRMLNRGETATVYTFGILVGGTIMIGAWGMPAMIGTDWGALPSIVWITIFYVAVFASAATFVLLQYATLRLPSAKVLAYTYLTPSWVILLELGWTGQAPPLLILVGVALTAIALVLLLRNDDAAG